MNARRRLPVLLLLFVGSGCAALIYEIVWFQLLQLVIGSSAVSLGVLLGTFMGGMCLGSLALPRVVSARHHPLRVYACLELGIGIIGITVLLAMPLVGGLYTAWAGSGLVGILLRGVAAGVCLVPPTLLMGATLPAISRWVETTPEGVSWLGFFYGGNIGGAVLGSLLAGFYLLRVYDAATATYVAVALNLAVALLALALAKAAPHEAIAPAPENVERSRGSWAVYVAIALSGMTALAAEVIWTRLLSLLFGATVYTFSLILTVFLLGLGIGSSLGAALARSVTRPRVALGWCQLLLCGAMAWAAYMLTESLPYWPINPSLSADPMFRSTEAMSKHISGVILYDETIRQNAKDGTPLVKLIEKAGSLPGIKVDKGTKPLPFSPNEVITEGLDGLRERLVEYRGLGAKFAKWRAVIDIGPGIPSYNCIMTNAHALARYAALCQEEGIVPIVEPEVLMDGDHDIDRCYTITEWTLKTVFEQLYYQRVALEGMVLKPNMVISGKKNGKRAPASRKSRRRP